MVGTVPKKAVFWIRIRVRIADPEPYHAELTTAAWNMFTHFIENL
jgi:hypothetical protein